MNKQTSPLKPKRIKALTRQFHDELIVYDHRRHRAHCLDATYSREVNFPTKLPRESLGIHPRLAGQTGVPTRAV